MTSAEPPVYYYRAIAGLEAAADTTGVQFEPWRKLDLQISWKTCSAVVYGGTLYVFWVEITTRPKSSLAKGSSKFTGYLHKLTVKFSSLRLDGRWSAPQRLRFLKNGVETQSIELNDPLQGTATADSLRWKALATSLRTAMQAGNQTTQTIEDLRRAADDADDKAAAAMTYTALLDPLPDAQKRLHPEPLDDYTLTHPLLVTAFPFASASSLALFAGTDAWTVDVFHRTATWQQWGATDGPALTLFLDAAKHARGVGDFDGLWLENQYATSGYRLEVGVPDTPSLPIIAPVTQTPRFAVTPVSGDTEAAVVTVGQDAFYVRLRNGAFSTVRLGSTIADQTAETLVTSSKGLELVLGVAYQTTTAQEAALPLALSPTGAGTAAAQIGFLGPGGPHRPLEKVTDLDYHGAAGGYYREIGVTSPG